MESTARALGELGDETSAVMSSTCDTWIDRSEAAALRHATPLAAVSAIYGYTAEHFSAMPLLAAAAILLNEGRLVRLLRQAPRELRGATGEERADRFIALCTDFSGCVSAALFSAGL
jgi:hypothetical protein